MNHAEQPSSRMLSVGLKACAAELPWGRSRRDLTFIATALDAGKSMPEILQDRRLANSDVKELLQEGIQTGRMASVLEGYLHSVRQSRDVWRDFRISLLTPLILLGVAALIFIVFLVVIVPQFKAIVYDFGVELPSLTMLLISISDSAVLFLGTGLALLLIAGGIIQGMLRLPFFARDFNRIPIMGFARRSAASTEFCSRLAGLIAANVPLDRALDVVSSTLQDAELRLVSKRMAEMVRGGASPKDISRESRGLLPAVAASFRWAGDRDAFVDSLRLTADLCAIQARIRMDLLAMIIEPATTIGVAFGAGFVVMALFMPLMKLLNELS